MRYILTTVFLFLTIGAFGQNPLFTRTTYRVVNSAVNDTFYIEFQGDSIRLRGNHGYLKTNRLVADSIRLNGAWFKGGINPAGSNGQVQFKNGSALGANSTFYYNSSDTTVFMKNGKLTGYLYLDKNKGSDTTFLATLTNGRVISVPLSRLPTIKSGNGITNTSGTINFGGAAAGDMTVTPNSTSVDVSLGTSGNRLGTISLYANPASILMGSGIAMSASANRGITADKIMAYTSDLSASMTSDNDVPSKKRVDQLVSVKENSLGNPSVDGQALISTTAGARSWATLSASPGGANSYVQVNNSGSFGGWNHFTYTVNDSTLRVRNFLASRPAGYTTNMGSRLTQYSFVPKNVLDSLLLTVSGNLGDGFLKSQGDTTFVPYPDSTGTGVKSALYLGTQKPTKTTRVNYNHKPFTPDIESNLLSLDTSNVLSPTKAGVMYWDNVNNTASLRLKSGATLQIGQEMPIYVQNQTGSTILNGKAVYVVDAGGEIERVALADNRTINKSYKYIGLTTTDIPHGGNGYVAIMGKVHGLNTAGLIEGKEVYLTTDGNWSQTKPTGAHIIRIGFVTYAHATNGIITVSPHNETATNFAVYNNAATYGSKIDSTQISIISNSTTRTLFNPNVADGSGSVAYTFGTHNLLNDALANHTVWKNQNSEIARLWRGGYFEASGIRAMDQTSAVTLNTNQVRLGAGGYQLIDINATSSLLYKSNVSDGATASAHNFDTYNTLSTSGAKIASFKNAGTEKASITKDGGYNITNTYLHEDSANIRNPVTKWHRVDTINVATANVWRNVKFKTNVSDESTFGIRPNSDSTGFVFNTPGVYRVSGYGHWTWFGAAGTAVKIYIRATQDGTEMRCTQTNDSRDAGSSADGSMRYEGTFRITTPGQVIRIQQRVDNASMDWQGSSVFDSPVSFTVNFQKISR